MSDRLQKTPLAEEHVALGARMVDFGGWWMPVQYDSLIEEHTAVRERAGLFDVSHMGEARVCGKDALAYLSYLTVNNPAKLADGQAHYTAMAYPEGTVVDDLLIYRIHEREYLLVINAANIDKDVAWMQQHAAGFDVQVTNESPATAQIAIQGPRAQSILQGLADMELSEIEYYWHRTGPVAGVSALVSRTGYTGEDGFEIYAPAGEAPRLWRLLLARGAADGVKPAGLGARDSLRLEARMHLYGNDMDHTTTLLEAGLGWIVKLKKKADFIGKQALAAQKKAGVTRKLVGFELTGKGIARHGYPVVDGGREIGRVTSGAHSPTLKKSVGLAYVPADQAEPGTELQIQIRHKTSPAVVVKGPFYQRS